MTEQQMVAPVRERLAIMAQQLWSGTASTAYPVFTEHVRTGRIPTH